MWVRHHLLTHPLQAVAMFLVMLNNHIDLQVFQQHQQDQLSLMDNDLTLRTSIRDNIKEHLVFILPNQDMDLLAKGMVHPILLNNHKVTLLILTTGHL